MAQGVGSNHHLFRDTLSRPRQTAVMMMRLIAHFLFSLAPAPPGPPRPPRCHPRHPRHPYHPPHLRVPHPPLWRDKWLRQTALLQKNKDQAEFRQSCFLLLACID